MTFFSPFRSLLATAVFAAALPACADDKKDKPAAEEKIKVTVIAILASTEHEKIDKRLTELAPELKKKNAKWTGFEVERTSSESIKVGDKSTFKLVDDIKVVVEIKERDQTTGCISLVVKPDTLGEVSYTCCCGKYVPVITRYDTKNKERLVIAIMVKQCGK